MENVAVFRETGAKWFRLMRIVLAAAAVMVVLLGIFSVYQPHNPRRQGSDWSAFIAVVAIAGFLASSLGFFGLWHQWRKPLRLGLTKNAIVLDESGTAIPWIIVDRVGFCGREGRFRLSMNQRLLLLVYVTDAVVVQRAARGIGGAWRFYWYRTPFMLDLAMIDAQNEDIFRAIQMQAPRDVLARSGMLEA
jgi:hypothetical protein